MTRALVLIDLQLDYFDGGAHPLVGPDAAVANAAAVLEQFRASGEPVIHVFEIWDEPEATFFRPGTPGVEIHPAVAPRAGERVVQKSNANAFLDTSLEADLRALGADQVVVVGMMTCVCIDSSVRAAADLGFDVTVVGDACAAPDLEFDGTIVPAAQVHAAFLAALGENFATVVTAEELLR
ncbi:MAG TPA: cysteine hydrolase family protein [Rhodoglobus sp.]|nr:cysteine hydrolase family protein [Rhodoglobus sp.]